ncbi:prolipoprotein diacylglyceryl transferase [bacterium]|nr:MAG: prolipoprotein diacylglyceryl transferase [bacterium]RKZ16804.1 MAG: prolipoprotein diacylglyceryl transferase [bacterium]
MIPVLFEIGPIKLYSFGLMVLLAFLGGSAMVLSELKRRGIKPDHLEGYPLVALFGGVVGARLYWVLTSWDRFTENPLGTLFGTSGLTWYGGLLGGVVAALWLGHRHRQKLWSLCDSFSPGLAAAYGIGRIGCHLSGDGDYGPPSDLPWAMAFPKGMVPTDVPVHPTPVYEILMMIPVVLLLWRLRLQDRTPGWLFGAYLVLVGIERWISEIFRVRGPDQITLGMSTAQWFSVFAVLVGLWLLVDRRRSTGAAS